MRAVASAWIVAFKIFNTLMFLSSRNEGIGSTKLMPPRYHLGELQQITNVKQDILICDQDFKLTIDHHPSDRNWGFAATDSAEGLACDRKTSIQMMVNWSYFKGATFVLTKFNDLSQFVTGIRWMFHFCIQNDCRNLPIPLYTICVSLWGCVSVLGDVRYPDLTSGWSKCISREYGSLTQLKSKAWRVGAAWNLQKVISVWFGSEMVVEVLWRRCIRSLCSIYL